MNRFSTILQCLPAFYKSRQGLHKNGRAVTIIYDTEPYRHKKAVSRTVNDTAHLHFIFSYMRTSFRARGTFENK